MSSEWIIGALAFITIGGVLALSVFHFGYQLKHPDNLEAAKRVAADRESATTRVSTESHGGRSLRQRLDEAPSVNASLGTKDPGQPVTAALFDYKWSTVRSILKGARV